MNPNILNQHCVNCGARVRPDQSKCSNCQQAPTDSATSSLPDAIHTRGAAAIQELVGQGGCPNIGCATVLLQSLTSADPAVVSGAAEALKNTNDPATLREMVTLLGAHSWLGHSWNNHFSEAQYGATSIPAIVHGAFSRQDESRKGLLLEALSSPNRGIREAASDLLQHYSGADVAERLVNALNSDPDPTVRARAAYAIGRQCDAAYVEPIINALHDRSPLVQSKAAQALSRFGSHAVPAAADTLNSGAPEAAFQSARILGQVGSEEAVRALIDALHNRRDLTRLYAEQALAQMGTGIVPRLLEVLIQHSDWVGVREGVAYIFRTMRMLDSEREILRPVIQACERLDAGLEVPSAAYDALGKLEGLTTDQLRSRLEGIR